MKKHTRIGLLILVTLMLTLALTIPGLADDPITYGDCQILFPTYTPNFSASSSYDYVQLIAVPGEYTVMKWEDGTLINQCEGKVPFEETARGKGKLIYFSYDDLATLEYFEWTENSAIVSSDTYGGTMIVLDTDGTEYPVTYWQITIYPEGDFVLYREYTP